MDGATPRRPDALKLPHYGASANAGPVNCLVLSALPVAGRIG